MKYQLLEIEQPCNDRKLIAEVGTMEDLHRLLSKLTDGKYTMNEYNIGDKVIHYTSIDTDRHFEVFMED
jgi:hypothetical protein